MLIHVATTALLTNIAVFELYARYLLLPEERNKTMLSDENVLHRVFVYGTLKRGEPNHILIQSTENGYAKFLGIGKTVEKYPLIIATKYNVPFLLKQPGTGNQINGEIYEIDSKMLSKLDELEDHPNFYIRIEENVLLEAESQMKIDQTLEKTGISTKAWIYFLPKFKSSLLKEQMYSSYSNEGSHGLKYSESDEHSAKPDDLF